MGLSLEFMAEQQPILLSGSTFIMGCYLQSLWQSNSLYFYQVLLSLWGIIFRVMAMAEQQPILLSGATFIGVLSSEFMAEQQPILVSGASYFHMGCYLQSLWQNNNKEHEPKRLLE